MHWRARAILVLAALVLALRLANAYAIFGPHVSRFPNGWAARAADEGVVVAGLSETDPNAAPVLTLGLRNDDIIREVWSVRGGGPIASMADFERAHYTVHRGETWTLLVERPPGGNLLPFTIPAVREDFLPLGYRSWIAAVWFSLVIPLTALATACLLGLGRPTSSPAFVGALMFLAFATLFEMALNYLSPGLRVWAALARGISLAYVFYLIFHFFMIFPDRSVIDRRLPWLRPGLLALVTAVLAARVGGEALESIAPATADALDWIVVATLPTLDYIRWAAALGLIAALISYWQAPTRDAQRRIAILLSATGILLFALLLPSVVRQLPADVVAIAFGIAAFLFPAAFAYVVLKDRVFGIALIVRRGVQYALVSRGFLFLEAVTLFAGFLYLYARVPDSFIAGTSNLVLLGGTAIVTLLVPGVPRSAAAVRSSAPA